MLRIVNQIKSWITPFWVKPKQIPKPKLIGPKRSLRMGIHWD
jgi:hypothetical protein